MNTEQKKTLIDNMTDNLPTLRKKLNLSQEDLGGKIGVSRSTVAAIENKKREMSWNTFLSLILIFTKNKDTDVLPNVLGIYTDELNEFIKNNLVLDYQIKVRKNLLTIKDLIRTISCQNYNLLMKIHMFFM